MKKYTSLSLFLITSTLASVLNYITYPLLARILQSDDYVDVALALSILTQIATIMLTIVALTIGITKDKHSDKKQVEDLQDIIIKIFIYVVLCFVVLSPLIFKTIELPNIYAIPVSLLLLFSIPTSIFSGYLNGKVKLVKVALVSLISATFQFIFALLIAAITNDGLLSLVAMACGQLFSILVILLIFNKDNLPKPSSIKVIMTKKINLKKPLIKYAIFSSVALLIVNLLQVLDLFTINSLNLNARIYTDVYVLSRILFFAGMMLVWPFLAAINFHERKNNFMPTVKLFLCYLLIAVFFIFSVIHFGDTILNTLMGTSYKIDEIKTLLILSLTYKFFWLCITAIVLYFVVIRNYSAIVIPIVVGIISAIYLSITTDANSVKILTSLNIISLLGLVLSAALFLRFGLRSYPHSVYTTDTK